ncbi:Protein FAM84A, partial [Cricetulus griseus]
LANQVDRITHIIHLHQGEILQDSLWQAGVGHVGRGANSWYHYCPLVAELVVQNACSHLGLKSEKICWNNSESFATWFRFGKREFKAGGRFPQACKLRSSSITSRCIWSLEENKVHRAPFYSLEDLICEKRHIDASGRLQVLQELEDFVDDKE